MFTQITSEHFFPYPLDLQVFVVFRYFNEELLLTSLKQRQGIGQAKLSHDIYLQNGVEAGSPVV